MVNIGDTVIIKLQAAFAYTLDPFAQPTSALQARLQEAGLKVVRIDASGLSVLGAAIFEGWGDLIVVVEPLASAFNTPEDIAGLVAGAADVAGFRVNYSSAHAQVLSGSASGSASYAQNLNAPDAVVRPSLTREITQTLDLGAGGNSLSGGIPGWAILALAITVAFVVFKK